MVPDVPMMKGSWAKKSNVLTRNKTTEAVKQILLIMKQKNMILEIPWVDFRLQMRIIWGMRAENREMLLSFGMNDVVTKPFNPDNLYAKIIRYINV